MDWKTVCLSGFVVSGMLFGGCLDQLAGGPSSDVTGILMSWTLDEERYIVRFNGELGDEVVVEVVDVTADIRQEVPRSAMTIGPPGEAVVRSHVALVDGHEYRVAVLESGDTLFERGFTASSDPDFIPPGYVGTLTYDVAFEESEDDSDGTSSFVVEGQLVVEATADVKRERMDAVGHMVTDDGEIRMELRDVAIDAQMENDLTTSSRTEGVGTWTSSSPDAEGEGEVTEFWREFETVERKMDEFGMDHEAERWYSYVELNGTLTIEGTAYDFYMEVETWEWVDRDSQELFWMKEDGFVRVSDPSTGQVLFEEPQSHTGPPEDSEDSETSLSDALELDGMAALPVVVGDAFAARGLQGIEAKYTVQAGGTMTVAGTSFDTVRMEGVLTKGASGTSTVFLVKDGPHAGVLLKQDGEASRGGETVEDHATLTGL